MRLPQRTAITAEQPAGVALPALLSPGCVSLPQLLPALPGAANGSPFAT